MTVTTKQKPIPTTYYMNNMLPVQCLARKEYIKYLGIIIDNKLTFNRHIETKCASATRVLNMLRRNLHFAPRQVKSTAYMTCVRPILEYASTCWSPVSLKQKKAIESVQNRAAKFTCNIYPQKDKYDEFSISSLIEDLQWDLLETRRNNAKISMVYKILNSQVILPPSTLPRATHNRTPRYCNEPKVGTKNQLFEPHSRLITTGKTFFFSAPSLWNNCVTPKQANAPSFDAFKKHRSNCHD